MLRTKTTMTQEKILQLTKQNGAFWVLWNYRDDSIREMCNRLVQKGLLKVGSYKAGRDEFLLAKKEE
jgi:hypothetical protein